MILKRNPLTQVAFLILSSSLLAQGVTSVTLQNFSGVAQGYPIVDNAGVPLAVDETTLQIGTFAAAFAGTFSILDPYSDESHEAVINNFVPAAPSSNSLQIDGLFNYSQDVDTDGSLAGDPAYVMIIHTPECGPTSALVLNLGGDFLPQDSPGNPILDLGRLLAPEDVVFGGSSTFVPVNTSSLPDQFQQPGFETGINIGGLIRGPEPCSIPEANTSLLLIAGLLALGRRRNRTS